VTSYVNYSETCCESKEIGWQNPTSQCILQREPNEQRAVMLTAGKNICLPISNGFVVNSKFTLLRACFEDGLQYMATAKPEECRTSRNTFVMQDVPVRDVIGLVYALTDEAKRETSFKNNTITVPICPASS